jgi:hypothetical protein
MRPLLFLTALLLLTRCSAGEFKTTLQSRTVKAFDEYARGVEAVLEQRWQGKRPFVALDEAPAERDRVLRRDLWIQPGNGNNPIAIDDGLIHDWVGAIFIPLTEMKPVVAVLQDFNRHSQIYPDVKQSRLISQDGNHIVGFWRLQRTQSFITVVLDVTQDAQWQQISSGKWACRAYAKDIREVDDPGTPNEKRLPLGQGAGFLWRMYAFWTLEAVNGGVLGECRTLSLSRNIPAALAWAIQPFIESLPRAALASTLRETRSATKK